MGLLKSVEPTGVLGLPTRVCGNKLGGCESADHPKLPARPRRSLVFARLFGSGFAGLGIHPYVYPGRTRCMRHGLPHARRIGRGMLLLLLPFRAFGHGRTGKLVDRAVAAGTLEDPITTSVDHSRHLAVAWHIFPAVPGVPLCIDL